MLNWTWPQLQVFVLPDSFKCRIVGVNICFSSKFEPTMDSEQVRTRLRVNRLGWMQKSQEPFEERARTKKKSESERWKWKEKARERERLRERERERDRRARQKWPLQFCWWHEAEWEERRGRRGETNWARRRIKKAAGEDDPEESEEGGERKRDEEKQGGIERSGRRGGARDWWGRVRN